jgi:hypothetical protein
MKSMVFAMLGIVLLGMTASGGEAVTETAMYPLPHSSYVALRGGSSCRPTDCGMSGRRRTRRSSRSI